MTAFAAHHAIPARTAARTLCGSPDAPPKRAQQTITTIGDCRLRVLMVFIDRMPCGGALCRKRQSVQVDAAIASHRGVSMHISRVRTALHRRRGAAAPVAVS
jgi:hypothetical protein